MVGCEDVRETTSVLVLSENPRTEKDKAAVEEIYAIAEECHESRW